MNTETPGISEGLVAYLERIFPNSIPIAPLNDGDIARLQGQQDVVRRLRTMLSRQNGTVQNISTSPYRDE